MEDENGRKWNTNWKLMFSYLGFCLHHSRNKHVLSADELAALPQPDRLVNVMKVVFDGWIRNLPPTSENRLRLDGAYVLSKNLSEHIWHGAAKNHPEYEEFRHLFEGPIIDGGMILDDDDEEGNAANVAAGNSAANLVLDLLREKNVCDTTTDNWGYPLNGDPPAPLP